MNRPKNKPLDGTHTLRSPVATKREDNSIISIFRSLGGMIAFVVVVGMLLEFGGGSASAASVPDVDPTEHFNALVLEHQLTTIASYTATPGRSTPIPEPVATLVPVEILPTATPGLFPAYAVPDFVTVVPSPTPKVNDGWAIDAGWVEGIDIWGDGLGGGFQVDRYITARYSFYWPPLGGVNNNGDDYMANGDFWFRNVGLAVACPVDFPFGTRFRVIGQIWVCMDRGEAIVQLDDGSFWLDFLEPGQRFPFGMPLAVEVDYP